MGTDEKTFDRMLAKIEIRERRSRRNAIIWTIVPVLAAFSLLGYSSWRLQTTAEEVAGLEEQAARYQIRIQGLMSEINARNTEIHALESKINRLDAELRTTQKQLRDTLDLSKHNYPIDLVDLKMIYSRYPDEARILEEILNLKDRGVGWKLRGESPDEGFDSPGFAEFILRRFERGPDIDNHEIDLIAASRKLFERLVPVSTPEPGDLVFYPAGYVMFYFVDAQEHPFVIGMTPAGIAALQPDFSQVLGYRRS